MLRRLWFALKERMFLRQYRSRGDRFSAIYADRLWKNDESASGFGSTDAATTQTRAELAKLIAAHDVGSILDAPCGDFNWMKLLPFAGHYTGVDIVPELIAANQAAYGSDQRSFAVADLVQGPLPSADLVMCRECLNHLPLAGGSAALRNLSAAGRKLLLVTHYPAVTVNHDQPASFRYRSLNLTLAPFNLRAPDMVIDEAHFEAGKVLAVWDLRNGPVHAAG